MGCGRPATSLIIVFAAALALGAGAAETKPVKHAGTQTRCVAVRLPMAAGAGLHPCARRCFKGGELLAARGHSRLAIKHHKLYGCWRGKRITWVIFNGRDVAPSESIRPFVTPATVAGRYAAVHLVSVGPVYDRDDITVVDLRTGRERRGDPVADWGDRTGMTVSKVDRLLLTLGGTAAWCSEGMNGFEVRVLGPAGSTRLLDAGDSIDPGSLRSAGRNLVWTDGGIEHSEPVE